MIASYTSLTSELVTVCNKPVGNDSIAFTLIDFPFDGPTLHNILDISSAFCAGATSSATSSSP